MNEHGCQSCGARLAEDQRWCLECGARRAGARLPFVEILAPPAGHAPEPVADTPAAGAAWRERLSLTPRTAAATAAAVFVMGVLLGGALGPGPLDSAASRAIVVAQQGNPAEPLVASSADVADAPVPDAAGDVGSFDSGEDASLLDEAVDLGGIATSDAGGDVGGTDDTGGDDPSGDETPVEAQPRVDRVVVLALGSGALAAPDGGAARTAAAAPSQPYLDGPLRKLGQFLPQYHAVGHGSLTGGIALISGQPPNPATQAQCPAFTDLLPGTLDKEGRAEGEGCVYPANVLTVSDQLATIGLHWGAYVEGMGDAPGEAATCRHPVPGAPDLTSLPRAGDVYSTRQNPFVYFHSIIDGPDCANSAKPIDRLVADLGQPAKAPDFVWVAPGQCNAGDVVEGCPASGPAAADAFAREWVPRILGSPAFKKGNGLLVVTFAEGPAADVRACCGQEPPGGGRVGAVVVSPLVTPGSVNRTAYNHYSVLRTTEDLFGLGSLGLAAKAKAFGKDVFAKTS